MTTDKPISHAKVGGERSTPAHVSSVQASVSSRSGIDLMLVLSCLLLNLFLSTHYLSSEVFDSDPVRMQGRDAWYHMRLVDHLVHNFPTRLAFDPLATFPGGQEVAAAPGLDFMIAGAALLLGWGAPSARLVDTVGAWVPPLLGAITLLPVLMIGYSLFGRIAALLAVALLAVAPGEFFLRTTLGFADHHAGEVLFGTLTIALLVAALRRSDRCSSPLDALGASLSAGLSLAAYLLTWSGGTFLLLVVGVWLLAQLVVDLSRAPGRDIVSPTVAPALAVAALAVGGAGGSLPRADVQLTALSGVGGILLAGWLVRAFALRHEFQVPGRLAIVVGIGVTVSLPVALGSPRLAGEIARLWPDASMLTVVEARPLLTRDSGFSLGPGWREFGLSFALLPVGLWALARRVVRSGRPSDSLFLAWAGVVAGATLYQTRFSYYLAAVVAILAGYVLARAIDSSRVAGISGWRARSRLAVSGLLVAAWVSNFAQAAGRADQDHGPPAAWIEALEWLRDNTDPAFDDPSSYLSELSVTAATLEPPVRYGVMNWWDHGWWILRIGRRVPISNPNGSGISLAAGFFLSQTPREARRLMRESGARYVVVDEQLVIWQVGEGIAGKFNAIPKWLDRDPAEFSEVYWRRMNDGTLAPVLFYYPEFHETAVARLFLHSAKVVTPDFETWVIRYAEREGTMGRRYKELLSSTPFTLYADALAYVEERRDEQLRIGGFYPQTSPIPLDKITNFSLVYESEEAGSIEGLPRIRIFEYREPDPAEEAGT